LLKELQQAKDDLARSFAAYTARGDEINDRKHKVDTLEYEITNMVAAHDERIKNMYEDIFYIVRHMAKGPR
jgi:hypothetical protein